MRTRPLSSAPLAATHPGHRAGLDAAQFGRGDFRAPLQAAAAYQAEQLGPLGHHRADRRGAGGNHAAVGRQHLGVLAAQLLRVEHGLGRLDARLGGLLGGVVLVDLLVAQRAGAGQGARARRVVGGVGRVGLRLDQAGAGLRGVGLHAVAREHRQHLARP
jgi:hypothetical protein